MFNWDSLKVEPIETEQDDRIGKLCDKVDELISAHNLLVGQMAFKDIITPDTHGEN